MADGRADRVVETPTGGSDTVIATGADGYWLPPGVEALLLAGAARIGVGNASDNLLRGSAAADRLHGQGGADTVLGGAGNDLLWGGAGGDLFRFGAGDGDDAILDFD